MKYQVDFIGNAGNIFVSGFCKCKNRVPNAAEEETARTPAAELITNPRMIVMPAMTENNWQTAETPYSEALRPPIDTLSPGQS